MTASTAARNLSHALPPLRLRLAGWVGRAAALLRSFGPYAAIELLLPGGSLLALLLWLYRRRSAARCAAAATGTAAV